MPNLLADISNLNTNIITDFINAPSSEGIKLAVIIYCGLLWLSVIIWVTRDSINRSESIIFQAFSIILNIAFPILGIFLYLIIRPGKTITERYYDELEHKLILENIKNNEKNDENSEKHDRETKKNTASNKKTRNKKTINKIPPVKQII